MKKNISTALVILVFGSALAAQAPDRLARIDHLFQTFVDDNRLGGAVALVLRDGKPVYEKAFGWADKEAGRKMTTDTIFRIASQTKAVTSAAVMSLVEEGKIALNDPVSRYIPGFGKTTVAMPADAAAGSGGEIKIVPARRQILIRDLLTHTAGISYGTNPLVAAQYEAKGLGPAAGFGWYTADKTEPICTTMETLATLPFVAQPGSEWVYGYNTDILGCIVERAGGISLDEFIRARITGPLGMKDTQFYLSAGQRERLAAVYGSATTRASSK
jgi:CubicO group peptidase (beta-lactamase class C family)